MLYLHYHGQGVRRVNSRTADKTAAVGGFDVLRTVSLLCTLASPIQ